MKHSSGFAGRLRALRKQGKLSQRVLAEKVGIHKIQLGRYERGELLPNSYTLMTMAKVLHVTTDYLLFGENTREAAVVGSRDEDLIYLFREAAKLSPLDRIALKNLMADFIVQTQKEQSPEERADTAPKEMS